MEPYVGGIRMFAGNFAPRGWAFCEGQLLAISQNNALFAILGTTYGGDGRTTFALPDMRGRSAMHAGQGPGLTDRRLGARSGTATVTLTNNEMPSHTHALVETTPMTAFVGTNGGTPAANEPAGNVFAAGLANLFNGNPISAGEELGGVNFTPATFTASPTGGSQAHNNMQPYLVVRYIIALVGIFPSRS